MNSFTENKKGDIILSFNGIPGTAKIESILAETEKILSETEPEISIRKKVYTVFVELIQNLFHHAEPGLVQKPNSNLAEIILTKDDFNYLIKTGNYIKNVKIPPLKSWIDKINNLSPQELKKTYLDVMQNSEFSEKGGASLGIIDIVRKSKNPVQYVLDKINDDVSYFEIEAIIQHSSLNIFKQKKNKKTPEIILNNKTGQFLIEGRSFPEDANEFYQPVIHWLEVYILQAAEVTTLEIYLEFFNTSSSKYILEILKRLSKIKTLGKKMVNVRWFYDKGDEDMFETGQDYKEICEINFEVIEK